MIWHTLKSCLCKVCIVLIMEFWTLQKYDSIHVDGAIHHNTSITNTQTHVTARQWKSGTLCLCLFEMMLRTQCYAKQALNIHHSYYLVFGQRFRAYELPFSRLQVWEISAKWNSDSVKQGETYRCTFTCNSEVLLSIAMNDVNRTLNSLTMKMARTQKVALFYHYITMCYQYIYYYLIAKHYLKNKKQKCGSSVYLLKFSK